MNVKCFCLSRRTGLFVSRRFDATLEDSTVEGVGDPSVLTARVAADARVSAVGRMEDESCVN